MVVSQNILKWFALLILFFTLGGQSSLFALDPQKTINQYGHDVWYRQNGLPSNAVNVGFQGHDGYLWLGTSAGLFRFDGVNFKLVNTNPVNSDAIQTIAALCMTKDSSLWVGTAYHGLLRIKNKKVTFIDPSVDPSIGIISNQIRVFLESRAGNLWIGTSFGLYKYTPGRFFTVPINPNFITALAEDSLGRIWVGTHMGVRIFNDVPSNQVDSITTTNGLPHNMVSALYSDRRGNIWIGTYDGLVCWNNNKITLYRSIAGLAENRITAICEDHDHNLWFGTYRGISRLTNGKWSIFNEQDGLSNNHVLSMIEDDEGSLWISTIEGLNRFKDVNVTTYTTKEGLANDNISSVAETIDGNIYFLSDASGTITCIKNNQTSIIAQTPVGAATVTRDGSLWIGQSGILYHMKDGKITKYDTSKGIPMNWISALTEDDKSLILHIDRIGIRRFINGRIQPYLMKDGKQYPSTEYVSCFLYQPNGILWVGTTGGLVKIHDGVSTLYRQAEGLAGYWIMSIFDDKKGNLWFSSPDGITHYKDGKFTPITFKNGLFTNEIYCILCDDSGNVWMSSPRGIGCIKKDEVDNFIGGRTNSIHTQVYSTADGMKSDECFGGWQPAGWKTHDGHIWFATKKGAVMIDPKTFKQNMLPPPVLIEEMVADQKIVPLDQFVNLSPGKENLEFHYTALSFLVPERVLFKYLLEGYDHEWVNAGTRRVAYYTNLPPGQYRFCVMACNNDGVWNETGTSYAFRLEPHFYQTYWFYGLLTVMVVGVGFGMYRVRVWQLLKREKELKESVDEALSNIKVLGGLIPICAHCKKIRDDKGYWDQLEKYIQTHSEAQFTHGICPDCTEKFY
jgi:ligand-binding sensor domain-containing protein